MQPSPELVKGVTGLNVYGYDTDVKCREGVGCVKILKELGRGGHFRSSGACGLSMHSHLGESVYPFPAKRLDSLSTATYRKA